MENKYQAPIKYSQNFLKSRGLVRRLIDKSGLKPEDIVIEIGPGHGIITEALTEKVSQVIAIEKDKNLFDELKENYGNLQNLTLVNNDFLHYRLPDSNYKIFSNIPFSISSEIIKKLFMERVYPIESYIIVQREVALKMIGKPVYRESQTSLLLKPFFTLKMIYNFSRYDFEPWPSVEIVLLKIIKRDEFIISVDDRYLYSNFIIYAFNQWKGDIDASLKKIFSHTQLKIIAKELGFRLDSIPTDLNFDQWVGLFNAFKTIVSKEKQKFVLGSEEKLTEVQSRMRKANFQIENPIEKKPRPTNKRALADSNKPFRQRNKGGGFRRGTPTRNHSKADKF